MIKYKSLCCFQTKFTYSDPPRGRTTKKGIQYRLKEETTIILGKTFYSHQTFESIFNND